MLQEEDNKYLLLWKCMLLHSTPCYSEYVSSVSTVACNSKRTKCCLACTLQWGWLWDSTSGWLVRSAVRRHWLTSQASPHQKQLLTNAAVKYIDCCPHSNTLSRHPLDMSWKMLGHEPISKIICFNVINVHLFQIHRNHSPNRTMFQV